MREVWQSDRPGRNRCRLIAAGLLVASAPAVLAQVPTDGGPDPSKVRGTTPEVRAAYDEAYRYLFEQIQDLVDAILGHNHQS